MSARGRLSFAAGRAFQLALETLHAGVTRSGPPLEPDRLDGRDPDLIASILPLVTVLSERYLRLRREGFDSIQRGPVLYVGNHNGGIAGPDVACTLGSLWEARGPEAPLYALAHDFAMRHFHPLGTLIQRFGALRARPENAVRALAAGAQVLCYPGGDLDAYRPARHRDTVVLGARTGFVRVAQAARVPIVPIVAHGAHRSAYILSEGAGIARLLRLKRWARIERFPIALALPWGLALGPWTPYLPLPFPIQLRMLPSMPAPADEDPAVIGERVRAAMQTALDELAERAKSPS